MIKGKYVAKITFKFNISENQLDVTLKDLKSEALKDSFADKITEEIKLLLEDDLTSEFTNYKLEKLSYECEEIPEGENDG